VNSTPWWFAVFTGAVGLLGVGAGGWLQKRTDRRNWLRSTKLGAYADVVSSAHEVMQRFYEELAGTTLTIGRPKEETMRALQSLARTASVVQMIARDDTSIDAIALQKGGEDLIAVLLDHKQVDQWRSSSADERDRFRPYVAFSDLLTVFLVTGRQDIDKT
jgi:hypothetical protein